MTNAASVWTGVYCCALLCACAPPQALILFTSVISVASSKLLVAMIADVEGSDIASGKRRPGQSYVLGWACGSGEPYSSSRGSRGAGGGAADTLPFDAAHQLTNVEYNSMPEPKVVASVTGNRCIARRLGQIRLPLAGSLTS